MISEVEGYWFEIKTISQNHVGVSVSVENPQRPRGGSDTSDRFILLSAWLTEQFIPFIATRGYSVPPPEKKFGQEKILAEGARRSAEAIRFEIVKVGLTEDEVQQLIRAKPPATNPLR